jgi:hypothetical protein
MGVEWGAREEALVLERADALSARYTDREAVLRDARWSVELELYRRAYRVQLDRARACQTPDEKRALCNDWRSRFGDEQAGRLIEYAKSRALMEASLSW